MHKCLAALLCCFPLLAAAQVPPHWQDTLPTDVSGPRVSLKGEIELVLRDGDYTCFVVAQLRGYLVTGQRLVACGPGTFGGRDFAPGAVLQATGNLGPAMPRRFADLVLDFPVVAAPLLRAGVPDVPPWPYAYPDPYWGPGWYPDPWYGPWPGHGAFWGLHGGYRR